MVGIGSALLALVAVIVPVVEAHAVAGGGVRAQLDHRPVAVGQHVAHMKLRPAGQNLVQEGEVWARKSCFER